MTADEELKHLVGRAIEGKLLGAEKTKLYRIVEQLPPLEGALSYSDICRAYEIASQASEARMKIIHNLQIYLESREFIDSTPPWEEVKVDLQTILSQPVPGTKAEVEDVVHALDNSTPYPVELIEVVLTHMAKQLMAMFTMSKNPSHSLWQPEAESTEPVLPAESF